MEVVQLENLNATRRHGRELPTDVEGLPTRSQDI